MRFPFAAGAEIKDRRDGCQEGPSSGCRSAYSFSAKKKEITNRLRYFSRKKLISLQFSGAVRDLDKVDGIVHGGGPAFETFGVIGPDGRRG